MAASALDDFLLFTQTTREKFIGDPKRLMSQAQTFNNTLYGAMINGLAEKKIIQHGNKISDFVQFSYGDSFASYNPLDTFEFSDGGAVRKLEIPWRFTKVHSVFHEIEDDLQSSDRETTFVRVRDVKENDRDLSWWEGHERQLWATPDYNAMENPTDTGVALKPYSLRCFITDDGLYPSSTNGGVAGAGGNFTTLMTVPNTETKFRNKVSIFDNTSDTTRRAERTGVVQAMDEMWAITGYKSPTDSQKYMQDTKLSKQRIVCNLPSLKLYGSLIRDYNDSLTPRNDTAFGQVLHHGIPITWVSILDSIDTDTAVAEGEKADADDGEGKLGFRYRYLNFNYIHPIFHGKHYRRAKTMPVGPAQPHSAVLFENTMENLWCANRRAQGIVRAAKSGETVS